MESGTKLGHYEISTLLGKGGMGEVYRATDTNLNRQVAIKVLPTELALDTERLSRFEREAKTLATLNHPNIAQIYGFEKSTGVHALVMELVEGPTLADRISQGPIPVNEALPIAKQIAGALEAAHEQGIIHRDLKPANVKVRPDGMVKVLDFGLAKATEPAGDASSVSMSPTLSMAATQAGMILGTAAYMSPEQARGKSVDKRADIWAFGCVLFEMLTGTMPFPGEDVSQTLARVIDRDPDWGALPSGVSPTLAVFLRQCLEKDSKRRLGDIRDMRLALEGTFDIRRADETTAVVRPTGLRLMPWVLGAVIGGIVVATTTWFVTQPVAPSVQRFSLSLGGGSPLLISNVFQDIAISPNGQQIVYSTVSEATGLQILSLSEGESTPLVAEIGVRPIMPFFSPDGTWVGFFDQPSQDLKRVSADGGPVETIAQVGIQLRGASWSPDGTIVYATATGGGLWRVSSTGGEPEQLTALGEGELNHWWPSVLPDGQAVLFTIGRAEGTNPRVAVLSLDTLQWKILAVEGTVPQYLTTGHLLYAVENTLRAVPFDLTRRSASSESILVEDDVLMKSSGAANYSVSPSGSLVYVSSDANQQSTIGWVNRQGLMTAPLWEAGTRLTSPSLSSEGNRVAYWNFQSSDIWIRDLSRGPDTRLTTEASLDGYPVWGPDNDTATFLSNRTGPFDLYSQRADLSRETESITASDTESVPGNWSRDGQILVYYEISTSGTNRDIWTLSLDGEPTPFLVTPSNERAPRLSPDGRWVSYVSDQSGTDQVYVTPFPEGGRVIPVSTTGGTKAMWSRDGRELFYRLGSQMWAVAIEAEPEFSVGRASLLFDEAYDLDPNLLGNPNYDVSLNGEQFLMVRSGTEGAVPITLVQNWFTELERLVPAP